MGLPEAWGQQLSKSSKQWVIYKDSALQALDEKRYDSAESSLIAALEECSDFKETDARNLLTLEKLAELYWYTANFEQARIFCEQLVSLYKHNHSLSRANLLAFSIDLAMIYHVSRDLDKAEKHYKSALDLTDKMLGSQHMCSTKVRSLYADLLSSRGDAAGAKALGANPKVVTIADWLGSNVLKLPVSAEESVPVEKQVATGTNKQVMLLSVTQPEAEAIYQSNLESAQNAENNGSFAYADCLYQINLNILKKFGVGGQILARAYEAVSRVKQKMGMVKDAIEYFQEAHKIKEMSLGSNHPVTAHSFGQLANFYYQLSDYENAEPLARKCADIYEKVFGEMHPEVACAIHNLATLYHVQRKYEHAETGYKRALDIKNKVFGPEHPETKRLMNSYAELLSQTAKKPDTDNGGSMDVETMGRITGSWKVMQVTKVQSLTQALEQSCDICGASLGGKDICPSCGFDTTAGI